MHAGNQHQRNLEHTLLSKQKKNQYEANNNNNIIIELISILTDFLTKFTLYPCPSTSTQAVPAGLVTWPTILAKT